MLETQYHVAFNLLIVAEEDVFGLSLGFRCHHKRYVVPRASPFLVVEAEAGELNSGLAGFEGVAYLLPCGPLQLLPLSEGGRSRDKSLYNVVRFGAQLVDLLAPEFAVGRLGVQECRNLCPRSGESPKQLQGLRVARGLNFAPHIGDAASDQALFPKQQVIHRARQTWILRTEAIDETEKGRKVELECVQKTKSFLLGHVIEVVLKLLEEVIEETPIHWFGFDVLSLVAVEYGEIVQFHGDIGVVRPERLFLDAQGAQEKGLRLCIKVLVVVQHGEIVEIFGNLWVVRSKSLFCNVQGAQEEGPGLGIIALIHVETCEIAETRSDFGVVGSERFFADTQSAQIEKFSLGFLAFFIAEQCEIIEISCDIRVVWTECLFADAHRAPVKWLCLFELTLFHVEGSEIVDGSGDSGVVWSKRLFVDAEGALVERLSRGILTLVVVERGEIIEIGRNLGIILPKRLFVDAQGALADRKSVV